jgi:hypothetical protein
MYLVSGHIIHAGRVEPRDSLFVSENIGREARANAVLEELVAFEGRCVILCMHLLPVFLSHILLLLFHVAPRLAGHFVRALVHPRSTGRHAGASSCTAPLRTRLLVACTGDSAPATTSKYGPACDSPVRRNYIIVYAHVSRNTTAFPSSIYSAAA